MRPSPSGKRRSSARTADRAAVAASRTGASAHPDSAALTPSQNCPRLPHRGEQAGQADHGGVEDGEEVIALRSFGGRRALCWHASCIVSLPALCPRCSVAAHPPRDATLSRLCPSACPSRPLSPVRLCLSCLRRLDRLRRLPKTSTRIRLPTRIQRALPVCRVCSSSVV